MLYVASSGVPRQGRTEMNKSTRSQRDRGRGEIEAMGRYTNNATLAHHSETDFRMKGSRRWMRMQTQSAVLVVALLVVSFKFQVVASLSLSMSSSSRQYRFRSFQFDKQTGICRKPASFQYTEDEEGKETQYFVMRNTPGDGDCVFHSVLSSVFISMGMFNPDAAFSSSMSSMALEMRGVVANYMSCEDGNLYVNNKPVKRIVRCRDLLRSAANNEGLSPEEYLIKLRQPGKLGGLYGGGPELTVLSNILRRPISIYHLKQQQSTKDDVEPEQNSCEVERIGVFGEGLYEDPGLKIPDGVVSNAVFFTLGAPRQDTEDSAMLSHLSSPLKCGWHLHILIADAGVNDKGEPEKHAVVLLPSVPILHNSK